MKEVLDGIRAQTGASLRAESETRSENVAVGVRRLVRPVPLPITLGRDLAVTDPRGGRGTLPRAADVPDRLKCLAAR